MVADLDEMKVEVVESQSFARDPADAVKKLQKKDVRIVLGNFNETWARMVLCEALKQGMVGRKHQWLLMGTYRSAPNIITCSPPCGPF
jgi:gamma-aminobutyric acid type B receptor